MIKRIIQKICRDCKRIARLRRLKKSGICYSKPNYIYRAPKKGSVIIDVGCSYEAELSVMMIEAYNATAFAVDPTRKHGEALRRLEKKYCGKFSYIQAALCADDCTIKFSESMDNESGSVLKDHINVLNDRVQEYEVEGLSLNSLLDRTGIESVDYLKLDLEGAEYQMLSPAPIEALKRCRQIFVEFHHHAVDRFTEQDTFAIVKSIESSGFEAYSIDDHNFLFLNCSSDFKNANQL